MNQNPLRADSGIIPVGEWAANDQEGAADDGFGFDFSDKPIAESVPVKKEEAPVKVEESSNKRHVDQLNADFDNDIDRALAQLSPPPGTRPAPGIKFDGPGTLDVAPDQSLEKTGVYDINVLNEQLRKMREAGENKNAADKVETFDRDEVLAAAGMLETTPVSERVEDFNRAKVFEAKANQTKDLAKNEPTVPSPYRGRLKLTPPIPEAAKRRKVEPVAPPIKNEVVQQEVVSPYAKFADEKGRFRMKSGPPPVTDEMRAKIQEKKAKAEEIERLKDLEVIEDLARGLREHSEKK